MRWKPIMPGGCRSRSSTGNFEMLAAAMRNIGAAVKAAIAHGWITLHPSGGYLMFTQAGADLFA
jgi:hypothetical protein